MEIFLDTETTGLSHQRDRIVEIALVDEEGNVLLDTLVNPNRQIPVQASRVHGITDQMVRKKKNIYALLPQINALIEGHDLIAYNAPFDIGFFPDQLSKAASVTCAMRVFAEYRGEKKALKLSEAAKIVGHEWSGNAHRALADTLACKSVWEATLKARKAGKLASAKKAPRPPKIIYEDELDQWAADSMRRLIRKFLAKKMSKATLLEVLVSEGALMGLTDSSMTRKEMDSIVKEAIDRSTAIAESSGDQATKPVK